MKKLRDLIERHIHSTGTGYEIDDIMSSGSYSEGLIQRIFEIHEKYRTPEYPVGISNPQSFEELRMLPEAYPEL